MNILLSALMIQSIGAHLCGASFTDPSVSVCYATEQSAQNPNGIDLQAYDKSGVYLTTTWTGPTTMFSTMQSSSSCVQWADDDWQDTTPCE